MKRKQSLDYCHCRWTIRKTKPDDSDMLKGSSRDTVFSDPLTVNLCLWKSFCYCIFTSSLAKEDCDGEGEERFRISLERDHVFSIGLISCNRTWLKNSKSQTSRLNSCFSVDIYEK